MPDRDRFASFISLLSAAAAEDEKEADGRTDGFFSVSSTALSARMGWVGNFPQNFTLWTNERTNRPLNPSRRVSVRGQRPPLCPKTLLRLCSTPSRNIVDFHPSEARPRRCLNSNQLPKSFGFVGHTRARRRIYW